MRKGREVAVTKNLEVPCIEDSIYVFPEVKLRGLVPIATSCIYERFVYSQDRSAYFAAAIGGPILGMYKSLIAHRYMNVGIGN
jgi:hypothetical protein